MRLNTHSYIHKQIRASCYWFEQATGLKLVTNLSEDFQDIRFASPLSYVTVDYLHKTIFAMCIKLDKKQIQVLNDLIVFCDWLICGEEVQKYLASTEKSRKTKK